MLGSVRFKSLRILLSCLSITLEELLSFYINIESFGVSLLFEECEKLNFSAKCGSDHNLLLLLQP